MICNNKYCSKSAQTFCSECGRGWCREHTPEEFGIHYQNDGNNIGYCPGCAVLAMPAVNTARVTRNPVTQHRPAAPSRQRMDVVPRRPILTQSKAPGESRGRKESER